MQIVICENIVIMRKNTFKNLQISINVPDKIVCDSSNRKLAPENTTQWSLTAYSAWILIRDVDTFSTFLYSKLNFIFSSPCKNSHTVEILFLDLNTEIFFPSLNVEILFSKTLMLFLLSPFSHPQMKLKLDEMSRARRDGNLLSGEIEDGWYTNYLLFTPTD